MGKKRRLNVRSKFTAKRAAHPRARLLDSKRSALDDADVEIVEAEPSKIETSETETKKAIEPEPVQVKKTAKKATPKKTVKKPSLEPQKSLKATKTKSKSKKES